MLAATERGLGDQSNSAEIKASTPNLSKQANQPPSCPFQPWITGLICSQPTLSEKKSGPSKSVFWFSLVHYWLSHALQGWSQIPGEHFLFQHGEYQVSSFLTNQAIKRVRSSRTALKNFPSERLGQWEKRAYPYIQAYRLSSLVLYGIQMRMEWSIGVCQVGSPLIAKTFLLSNPTKKSTAKCGVPTSMPTIVPPHLHAYQYTSLS